MAQHTVIKHHNMKGLLLFLVMGLAALTMTQCSKDNGRQDHSGTVVIVDPNEDEYVDLGLVSMTLWKASNEKNEADAETDYFTYDEAVALFGDKLPTMEQFYELMHSCRWEWVSLGFYKIIGPNGHYILLPASGCRDCNGEVDYDRRYGFYWSSTPDDDMKAWYLNFYSREIYMYRHYRCFANSVRLVERQL